MAEYLNHYACSECGHHWTDEWSCMCDDRCPNCNTPISPYFSKELGEKAEIEEETEEEHAVRLRRISDEIKADMKAGRYRHGQLRPEISASEPKQDLVLDSLSMFRDMPLGLMEQMIFGRMGKGTLSGRYTTKRPAFHELYGSRVDRVIMDECHYIKSSDMWIVVDRGKKPDGPRKPYWTQPIPEKGSETPPSKDKRAKLRAKRKKRK